MYTCDVVTGTIDNNDKLYCFIAYLVDLHQCVLKSIRLIMVSVHSSSVVVFNLMTTRWTCTSVLSVVFNLMPSRWTCTSVCSIDITCDSDGKRSSSVVFNLMPTACSINITCGNDGKHSSSVVFNLMPTRWTCTSACSINITCDI